MGFSRPADFWRQVKPDEARVPKRADLRVVEAPAQLAGNTEAKDVHLLEEEIWLCSSDSKCYARWCLHGASPAQKAKLGLVLVPEHPELNIEGQVNPESSMNSELILAVVAACQEAKIPTLRFDYRGIGKSKGSYDLVSSVRDAVAAVQAMCGVSGTSGPCEACVVIGIGIGSAQSIGNLYTKGITQFISLGHGHGLGSTRPDGSRRDSVLTSDQNDIIQLYNRTNIFFTTMRISIPKLWILGARDPLSPLEELKSFLSHYSPGRGQLSTIIQIPNAVHDFRSYESYVAKLILDWLSDPKQSSPISLDLQFANGAIQHSFS